jgi:hypothetical protein
MELCKKHHKKKFFKKNEKKTKPNQTKPNPEKNKIKRKFKTVTIDLIKDAEGSH